MGKVIAQGSMSLDGFIADANDDVGPLFDWYQNGDVEVTGSHPDFRTSAASAAYLRQAWSTVGVDVIGRRLFDLTNGWNGRPVVGEAVFVLTHQPPTDWPYPDAPFTFVTDGLDSALAQAQAVAGDRDVSITPGNIAGQAFAADSSTRSASTWYPWCSAPASGSSATTPNPRSCSRTPTSSRATG